MLDTSVHSGLYVLKDRLYLKQSCKENIPLEIVY